MPSAPAGRPHAVEVFRVGGRVRWRIVGGHHCSTVDGQPLLQLLNHVRVGCGDVKMLRGVSWNIQSSYKASLVFSYNFNTISLLHLCVCNYSKQESEETLTFNVKKLGLRLYCQLGAVACVHQRRKWRPAVESTRWSFYQLVLANSELKLNLLVITIFTVPMLPLVNETVKKTKK